VLEADSSAWWPKPAGLRTLTAIKALQKAGHVLLNHDQRLIPSSAFSQDPYTALDDHGHEQLAKTSQPEGKQKGIDDHGSGHQQAIITEVIRPCSGRGGWNHAGSGHAGRRRPGG